MVNIIKRKVCALLLLHLDLYKYNRRMSVTFNSQQGEGWQRVKNNTLVGSPEDSTSILATLVGHSGSVVASVPFIRKVAGLNLTLAAT